MTRTTMTDVPHAHDSKVPRMPAPDASKALWREWARWKRAQLSAEKLLAEAQAPGSAAVCEALLTFLRNRQITGVLAYHALAGEIDLSALASPVSAPQLRLYTTRAVFRPVPRLTLHAWESASEVSRFGARQPPRGTPEVSREQIGAVLLPGLAFDQRGWRLGYGGGFYDRLLEDWPVLTVGVVAGELWLPQLPHEPHDLPVDFVATELGVRATERP
ncbi:5-formyltetrahydrofolate cyclo-ligase [Deinococcus altitudinis]|uniref:5-formyltetrahydrofolate cyclo-ligase n=1 Tax=Deinococcus altitudinis TaxID=468914 RepID=UPI003892AFBA